MAEKDKTYYWLRLRRDFFKRHDIKILANMPDGDRIVLFYLKLLCESVDHAGRLRFSEDIPYDADMLGAVLDMNAEIVATAIDKLKQLKLIEIAEDGTIIMSKLEGLIGSETYWAKNKREQRTKEDKGGNVSNTCPTIVQHVSNDCPTCPSKSKSIDIDIYKKEKEKEKTDASDEADARTPKHKYGEYKNVLLTDAELEKLKGDFTNWQQLIESLSNYIASTGKRYKSHYATIRNWARRDGQKTEQKSTGFSNFEAHQYSSEQMAELERRLLERR